MDNPHRARFERDGYYIAADVIHQDLVDRLNALGDHILAQQDPEHFAQHKTTGSMVLIDWAMTCDHPAMAELVAHPNMLSVLDRLGFDQPKFGHGRIISKPPHSPPLFWHEDGRFWNDPVSYTAQPIQVFLMYYLTDTTPQNGCLRVVPGSHRRRHPLHDRISPRHTKELAAYENPDDPGFSRVDDEIDVPVKAGDLVIGYGNLLHASHANQSTERRTVLTMCTIPITQTCPSAPAPPSSQQKATTAISQRQRRRREPCSHHSRSNTMATPSPSRSSGCRARRFNKENHHDLSHRHHRLRRHGPQPRPALAAARRHHSRRRHGHLG